MKQISLISALTLMLAVSAEAAERQPAVKDDISWRANFKRVALEISGTEVSNAEQYKDSPSTQLNADSETVIKGVFDFALERETAASLWSNSLLMKYGKTTLRPAEGESTPVKTLTRFFSPLTTLIKFGLMKKQTSARLHQEAMTRNSQTTKTRPVAKSFAAKAVSNSSTDNTLKNYTLPPSLNQT